MIIHESLNRLYEKLRVHCVLLAHVLLPSSVFDGSSGSENGEIEPIPVERVGKQFQCSPISRETVDLLLGSMGRMEGPRPVIWCWEWLNRGIPSPGRS
jgi:hypothetical protein